MLGHQFPACAASTLTPATACATTSSRHYRSDGKTRLRDRAAIAPHSPLPLPDELLTAEVTHQNQVTPGNRRVELRGLEPLPPARKQQAARPPTSMPAGHRPRASHRVPLHPLLLRYFRAVLFRAFAGFRTRCGTSLLDRFTLQPAHVRPEHFRPNAASSAAKVAQRQPGIALAPAQTRSSALLHLPPRRGDDARGAAPRRTHSGGRDGEPGFRA